MCIINPVFSDLVESLEKLGIFVLPVKGDKTVDLRLSYHADMLFHHLGGERIALSQNCLRLSRQLSTFGFEVEFIKEELKNEYPYDIALNAARVGDYIICNEKHTSKTILEYCKSNKISVIHTNQGYSKCSVCVVDNNAIITSDKGIVKSCSKFEIDALMVNPGHITLKGYDFGFIGGASAKISKHELAFFGDINSHPDCNRILDFLQIYGVEPVCLLNGTLRDIGGAISLSEI